MLGEVVFQIVGVMGDVLRGVGDAGETVGVVIGIGRDFSVLVRHRDAAAARVIGKADRGRVRIGDAGEAVAQIVSERGAVLLRVHDGSAVAAEIIFVGGDI